MTRKCRYCDVLFEIEGPNERYCPNCKHQKGKRCIDCGVILKKRGKLACRCKICHLKQLNLNSHGRTTPNCLICGEKISAKLNKTGKCKKCYIANVTAWNKGLKGSIPWNKGISLFSSKQEFIIHKNKIRKQKRDTYTNEQKIPDRIRTLIRNSIKFQTDRMHKKNTKTTVLLGCTIKEYKNYLESLFVDGMNWGNYGHGIGKWSIDHIEPLAGFDLSIFENQLIAFNHKNTQPMWSIENSKKSNKPYSEFLKLKSAVLTCSVTY